MKWNRKQDNLVKLGEKRSNTGVYHHIMVVQWKEK